MGVYDLMLSRRSVRRFKDKPVPYELLEKCVNAARLAPNGGNMQPMEFIIVDDRALVDSVFDMLIWTRSLKPQHTPPPGHRPTAYIVMLLKTWLTGVRSKTWEVGHRRWRKGDIGFAAENMILAALEEGVASCCFGDVKAAQLKALLKIPDGYTDYLVIAFGYPDESPVVEDYTGSIQIWRDQDNVIHVPKRNLSDILHRNGF